MSIPLKSPKPRHADRFIPMRAGNSWDLVMSPTSTASSSNSEPAPTLKQHNKVRKREEANKKPSGSGNETGIYSLLLKSEVLGYQMKDYTEITPEKKLTPNRKLFHFDITERSSIINSPWASYSSTPISETSEQLLRRSARKPIRRIAKVPYKVLDAPELQDDFYLNLVDWSSQNSIAVGLGTCVYLWSAYTSQVSKLCDLAHSNDLVTSVSWNQKGGLVAIGTQTGLVKIWDAAAQKQVSVIPGHTFRVGATAWNGDLIASGSRDKYIHQNDIRIPSIIPVRKLAAHRQEVCGLKWSPDNQFLASGGNDNQLCVWNMHSPTPIQSHMEHTAAVKAIAWSPHNKGILASGGGTADKHIRFWNTMTGQPMQSVDTGSQVCNLTWSSYSSEFVSTHGYSQNQIILWKYPSLQKIAELTGHTNRVLYLAKSPDGESIVTGAGDETLRFWSIFKKKRTHQKENQSTLSLHNSIR